MKRLALMVTAGVAAAALAGCTSPPDALDLASRIPNVTPTSGTSGDVPPVVPAPTTVARYDGPDGLDIIATFPTDAARTTWARAVAAQYGSDYVEQRVDGECWTMITTAWHTYRRGDPPVQNITDAAGALRGKIKSIGSPE